jgi:transposase InsO family protein
VSAKISLSERLTIAREWRRQGFTGARPVINKLPGVRVRVVRQVIAELKSRRQRRQEVILRTLRVSVKVKRSGTMATMDGATVRKGDDYIVLRDRGSLSVESSSCNGPMQSVHVLALLMTLKEQERLPLVMCSDNGSPFCSNVVRIFLESNQVVHLKSLPYVPQHNGSCENAVKEMKALIKEGFAPLEACHILNKNRRRQKIGYQTSTEFNDKNFQTNTIEKRSEFYEAAKQAIKKAQLGTGSVLNKRKAEREAIFQTMERFDLITRTRGGLPYPFRPEDNA